jgi:hypothetical protein
MYNLNDERLMSRFRAVVEGIPTNDRPSTLRITTSDRPTEISVDPHDSVPGM